LAAEELLLLLQPPHAAADDTDAAVELEVVWIAAVVAVDERSDQ